MAERLKRIGTGTILLPNRPGIAQTAAIVGKKEGEGPLHSEFDAVIEDDLFGEETWEKAESRFHYTAADTCLKKAGATPESVDVTLGGDLLNQIMAASTAAQKLQTPFLGIYGACSTMAETLCIGAMLCGKGQPSSSGVTSMLRMSPSFSTLSPGIPWQITWLIEMQEECA